MDTKDLWCIEAQAHGIDETGWSYSHQVPRFYVFAEHEAGASEAAMTVLRTASLGEPDFTLVVVARWVDMIPAPLSQPG